MSLCPMPRFEVMEYAYLEMNVTLVFYFIELFSKYLEGPEGQCQFWGQVLTVISS